MLLQLLFLVASCAAAPITSFNNGTRLDSHSKRETKLDQVWDIPDGYRLRPSHPGRCLNEIVPEWWYNWVLKSEEASGKPLLMPIATRGSEKRAKVNAGDAIDVGGNAAQSILNQVASIIKSTANDDKNRAMAVMSHMRKARSCYPHGNIMIAPEDKITIVNMEGTRVIDQLIKVDRAGDLTYLKHKDYTNYRLLVWTGAATIHLEGDGGWINRGFGGRVEQTEPNVFEYQGTLQFSPDLPDFNELDKVETDMWKLAHEHTDWSWEDIRTEAERLNPVEPDPVNWMCNSWWRDGGLQRISFKFRGFCEDTEGECFLKELKREMVLVHNWQAWDTGDGWWQADLSTFWGQNGNARYAIKTVTGIDASSCW